MARFRVSILMADLFQGVRSGVELRRAPAEVRRQRCHILPVDDPIAVDILRATVARAAEVARHLQQIGVVHGPVTVHVRRARALKARVEVHEQNRQIRDEHVAVAVEIPLAGRIKGAEDLVALLPPRLVPGAPTMTLAKPSPLTSPAPETLKPAESPGSMPLMTKPRCRRLRPAPPVSRRPEPRRPELELDRH